MLDSGDFFSFLIEKSSHVYNTQRMIQKDNTLLTRARFTIRAPLPFTSISRLLLLLQFFPLFSTYTVFHHVYPQFLYVIFTVFSRNLSKSMQDKNTRLCSATVSDIIFPNAATVLWYFEVLLIGIILPQFEGRFKHFLLVIRIIHTSRSIYSYISKNSISSFFLASDTRQLINS